MPFGLDFFWTFVLWFPTPLGGWHHRQALMLGSRMALPTHSTRFVEGKSSPVLWTASGVCQCLSLKIFPQLRIMSIVDSSICIHMWCNSCQVAVFDGLSILYPVSFLTRCRTQVRSVDRAWVEPCGESEGYQLSWMIGISSCNIGSWWLKIIGNWFGFMRMKIDVARW